MTEDNETDWKQRINEATELTQEKLSMTVQFSFVLPRSLLKSVAEESHDEYGPVEKRIAETYAQQLFRRKYNSDENAIIGSPRITVEDRGSTPEGKRFRAVCVY